MVTRSIFYFINRIGKANLMTLLSQVPLAFTPETKMSADTLCPTPAYMATPAGYTLLKFLAALAWTSCKPKAIVGAPPRDELGRGLLSADRG